MQRRTFPLHPISGLVCCSNRNAFRNASLNHGRRLFSRLGRRRALEFVVMLLPEADGVPRHETYSSAVKAKAPPPAAVEIRLHELATVCDAAVMKPTLALVLPTATPFVGIAAKVVAKTIGVAVESAILNVVALKAA